METENEQFTTCNQDSLLWRRLPGMSSMEQQVVEQGQVNLIPN